MTSAYFLGAFLLYAGVDKLLHYGGFVKALTSYVIFPDGLAPYLALPLILSELWVGFALLYPPWRRSGALAATVLLVVFTAALVVNRHYAPGAACGCWFTLSLGEATTTHVLLNLAMVGLALTLWADPVARPQQSVEPPP